MEIKLYKLKPKATKQRLSIKNVGEYLTLIVKLLIEALHLLRLFM